MSRASLNSGDSEGSRTKWVGRTVLGIVLATFFSDASHEMCTAVLPMFLMSVGLGPAALGMIEGVADLLKSLSKLGGGILGHHLRRKQPSTAAGYLVTSVSTGAIGIVSSLPALISLRCAGWVGRGFRSPLRDYLLSDAVERTHYGRAFGLERAGDMLGAVTGPLLATLLIWDGMAFRAVILWTFVPGLLAAGCMFFLVKERATAVSVSEKAAAVRQRVRFPKGFWLFLIGVFFFGLGDFSRTFLIWLAAHGLGESGTQAAGTLSLAALLYTLHNLVSAAAAYPVGYLGDRRPKMPILVAGYALGVVTNAMLAAFSTSLAWLGAVIVLSGVYIAVA